MKKNLNPDDDVLDPSEIYFKNKENNNEPDTEEYFPEDTLSPPHY